MPQAPVRVYPKSCLASARKNKRKGGPKHPGRRCFSNPQPPSSKNQGKTSNFCYGTAVLNNDSHHHHTNSVADDELVPEEFGRFLESSSLTGLSTI